MEYRPGGGQRTAGGGMQFLPGGGSQFLPQELIRPELDDWNALQGRAAEWQNNGGQGVYSETSQAPEDEMNQWRRRLKGMQQAGPNMNQFYGAF